MTSPGPSRRLPDRFASVFAISTWGGRPKLGLALLGLVLGCGSDSGGEIDAPDVPADSTVPSDTADGAGDTGDETDADAQVDAVSDALPDADVADEPDDVADADVDLGDGAGDPRDVGDPDAADDADGDADGGLADAPESTDGEDTDGADAASPDRPNILLVIADDLGVDLASFDPADPCYDVGDVSNDPAMPNLAGLCRRGTRFTSAWAMPTCSPTRASLMTGTLPSHHGVGTPELARGELALDSYVLPRALDDATTGYAHAVIGKWHVSLGAEDPNTMGWDHFAGPIDGVLRDYELWDRTVDGATTRSSGYATSVHVDDAIAWLDGLGDEPWLLWLAFEAPHTPYHVPPLDLHERDDLSPYVPGESDARPYAAAMAEAMDMEIGRLLDHLDVAGDLDETIVVFLGDNGTSREVIDQPPFAPRRAKGSLYEGGLRVPLLIAGPGVAGPAGVDAVVSVVDLFPTILELAGVDVAAALAEFAPDVRIDGVSLVSCVDGSGCAPRTHVFAESFGHVSGPLNGKAVRDDTMKLICGDDGALTELYDLSTDARERIDLYEGPDTPGYVALRDALRAAVGDGTVCP